MSSSLWQLQMFDPTADFVVFERKLPHWSQAGTLCFITWRTADSIPKSVANRWHADRKHWLSHHGIAPKSADWREQLQKLAPELRADFVRRFSERWHRSLDQCQGACVFRNPKISGIVRDSLLHFDGDRYEMTDFIIMPNHVHVLCAFVDEAMMLTQCQSWKHFTATAINREIGSSGHFWQQDGFDHLVRSEEQFKFLRNYIAQNGSKACLSPEAYLHYSKAL